MTTIAYRDGVMAADMAVRFGSIYGYAVHKIVRRDDGALCGTCGMTALGAGFKRWFLAGEVGERPSFGTRDGDEDMQAIIARPNGKVEVHDRLGWSEVAGSPYLAIGSGSDVALGAMAMGADAREAVEVAISFGVGRLGEVEWISIAERDEEDLPAALEPASEAEPEGEGWIKLEPDQSIQISRLTASHSLFGGVTETRHVQFLTEFGQIVDAGMIGTSTVDGSKHLGGKNTHYRIVTDFPPATEPAHEQDAAPLPQPQTDAGSAQADTQGAGTAYDEATDYLEPYNKPLTIAPGDALPDSTGPESDGAVFMRLDGERAAWTNDDTGQTEAPAWPVGSLSDAICDGEAGDPAEVWTGRLDPEHKIGGV